MNQEQLERINMTNKEQMMKKEHRNREVLSAPLLAFQVEIKSRRRRSEKIQRIGHVRLMGGRDFLMTKLSKRIVMVVQMMNMMTTMVMTIYMDMRLTAGYNQIIKLNMTMRRIPKTRASQN